MRTSFFPELYKCPKCGKEQEHYVWSNEVEKKKHNCIVEGCKGKMSVHNIVERPTVELPMIKTPTANRVRQAQRKKRNTDHFKKEIYPNFKPNSLERKHFSKKLGIAR